MTSGCRSALSPKASSAVASAKVVRVANGKRTLDERSIKMERTLIAVLEDKDTERRSARCEMIRLLREKGKGSFLRGWRSELDPDGDLSLTFPNLCKGAAALGFVGNVELLCGTDDDVSNMTLAELSPEDGALADRFKAWIHRTFGADGPGGLWAVMEEDGSGQACRQSWIDAVDSKGFTATDAELYDLYCMCDTSDVGYVTRDDLVFLEVDPATRRLEMFKIKTRQKDQRQRFLASVYTQERELQVPPWHRLAPRNWMASKFEQLPTVITQRKGDWERESKRKAKRARQDFLDELRYQHGNEVRAFRRKLDTDGTYQMTKKALKKFCRETDSKINVHSLWKSLERSDGLVGGGDCWSVAIEELCPQQCAHLAAFRHWAYSRCRTCSELWDSPETRRARSESSRKHGFSDKKCHVSTFVKAVKDLGWPGIHDQEARIAVTSALDLYSCHMISKEDLIWLDGWHPSEWMWEYPDQSAWDSLRELIIQIYKHPLRAWRSLFDRDDSNQISWKEFQEACNTVRFLGNVGGAWRVLDADLSGYISMREYDFQSAQLLSSFKEWAESNFGSVRLTFKSIDSDGSGTITLSELKRVCNKLKWQGDVRLLFDCLDVDGARDCSGEGAGKRSLSMQEVAFLDRWKMDSNDEEAEDTIGDQLLKRTHLGRYRQSIKEEDVRRAFRRNPKQRGKTWRRSSRSSISAKPWATIMNSFDSPDSSPTRRASAQLPSAAPLARGASDPVLRGSVRASTPTIPENRSLNTLHVTEVATGTPTRASRASFDRGARARTPSSLPAVGWA